jgi:hypothetical protein
MDYLWCYEDKDALSPVSAEQVGLTLIIFCDRVFHCLWCGHLLHAQTHAQRT